VLSNFLISSTDNTLLVLSISPFTASAGVGLDHHSGQS
jgi:hypothetical protein